MVNGSLGIESINNFSHLKKGRTMEVDFLDSKRLEDTFYLKHPRYDKPLEIFKFNESILLSHYNDFVQNFNQHTPELLDIGAAVGEFLYYMQRNNKFKLSGLEKLPSLQKQANKKLGDIVKNGDVFDVDCFKENQFDYISMTNVHMIFDDLTTPFKNIRTWLKPGGLFLMTGAFNPNKYSVWVRYKDVINRNSELEHGWNIHSLFGVEHLLKKTGFKNFSNKKFVIPIDIMRDKENELRQYTFETKNNERIILNGLSQHVQIYATSASK